ncbi:ABC transporter substrate-binding protein [Thalassotalea sp. LPB0316]|uniref:substrate-binding periplasmic protein n=1 Tax=Thalassotalea sp. LPB0316 TaxID=2769490 RepID=UPI001867D719|nr:transporter substrate-binding domain-containing protein [Thalassotalea sp. LPB0316]QOL26006.1 ABC transporter substrate-binding protein [Thalassotalea sp. LPB0316]
MGYRHISVFFVLLCLSMSSSAKELIYLYTYHNKPPFIVSIEKQQGFYFDLASELSKQSADYQFQTLYIPRKRLNHIISEAQLDGIVLGVTPKWFKDPEETKYLWSDSFYRDRDEFVSLKSSPFNYLTPDSFNDKTVAAVAGFYYFGVNEAVAQSSMSRIDTVGELQVLKLIEKRRVDFGIVSYSVFKYLLKHGDVVDNFYTSPIPHDEFKRRAFTSLALSKEMGAFNQLLDKLKRQGQLQQLLTPYQ